MKKLSIIKLTSEALSEKELSKIYGGESCLSASCGCSYSPDDSESSSEAATDAEVT